MRIKSEKFILELSHDELYNIAWAILRDLQYNINNKHVNQQQNWMEDEKNTLSMLNKMFMHTGHIDLYEGIFDYAERVFKQFNNQKNKKK